MENAAGMAPFELLPNEMAEIPIKMAMAKMNKPLQKYEFLCNVVAKISTRFATLALKLMQELTVPRPPRMRFEGKRRWMVEHFKDDHDIAVEGVRPNQGGNSIDKQILPKNLLKIPKSYRTQDQKVLREEFLLIVVYTGILFKIEFR